MNYFFASSEWHCVRLSHDSLHIIILFSWQASVDINIRTSESNSSPLHAAVQYSHWSVVECLVGWGAALNPTNNKGNTPLHDVIRLQSPVIPESPQLKLVNYFLDYDCIENVIINCQYKFFPNCSR